MAKEIPEGRPLTQERKREIERRRQRAKELRAKNRLSKGKH